jgi:hypothetical protein
VSGPDDTAQLLQHLLFYLLLPVWMLAGFGDWLCHRVQRIEHSSGLKESLLHLLMLGEIGLGIVAALLLEVNAAVLALLLACCVAHELTTWWDLRYAASLRRIPVVEQWVHGVQQMLPWTGLFALAVVHREQAAAIVGRGGSAADWVLRWKDPPLPAACLGAVFAGGLAVVLLPFLQELMRCRRARRGESPPR